MSPLLEVRGVTKRFGGATALDRVSLTVNAREVVAVVGDNGAGKSTLVKIISGILQPDEGVLRINGQDSTLRSAHSANEVGVQTVYQDLALCNNLDTVQNLFLGSEVRTPWFAGRRLKRAAMERRAMDVLGSLDAKIKDVAEPVSSLSGGQRQAVAVCRSILAEPKLVILDEPTAALGVAQRRQVLALIDRLRAQGRGVIVISHDLADVVEVADRVEVLRLGRNVASMLRGEFDTGDLVGAITGISRQMEGHSDQTSTETLREGEGE
jgi:D-xylose transport system ATP-binding protein